MKPASRTARPDLPASHQQPPAYCRLESLPALLGLWPHELEEQGAHASRVIIERLEKALRAERRRGRSGCWTYDINRHMRLVRALKEERRHLNALEPCASAAPRRTAPVKRWPVAVEQAPGMPHPSRPPR